MFILIRKDSQFVTVFSELSRVLPFFDLHRTTLSNKLKGGKYENEEYILYKSDKDVLKSKRGGKNSGSFDKYNQNRP